MGLNAILIAGGQLPEELRQFSPHATKALLPVNGRTLLHTAVDAAKDSGLFDRIVVSGNHEVVDNMPEEAEYVQIGADVVDNIMNAYEHLGGHVHDYVVLSPDLPRINAEVLGNFVSRAQDMGELCMPVVSREDFLTKFPGAKNRFEKLDGGHFTMGSAFYITGPVLRQNMPLARDLFHNRKSVHKMAIFFGLPVVWGMLTGRLTLALLERRAEQLTGARVRGVHVRDAGIAYDIDDLENYRFINGQSGE
ncbi:MAG: NTP transferase domain-containing protein [Planctomycetales bacterium]|nr:NTP transferase domain-containing protein [bacterium]UNM08779.1 MAG: NTP transferase domain-containing protein [Planctomycetales bacterium]